MKIKTHGMILVTPLSVEATGFEFHFDGKLHNPSCDNEVIRWAIKRLESELHDDDRISGGNPE